MSAGTRSGVNWTRENEPPTTRAKVSTARVFATPGTPSSSRWPLASRPTSIRSTSRSCPTMTRLTSNTVRSSSSPSRAGLGGPLLAAVESTGACSGLVTAHLPPPEGVPPVYLCSKPVPPYDRREAVRALARALDKVRHRPGQRLTVQDHVDFLVVDGDQTADGQQLPGREVIAPGQVGIGHVVHPHRPVGSR